jgi:hypothetical protein
LLEIVQQLSLNLAFGSRQSDERTVSISRSCSRRSSCGHADGRKPSHVRRATSGIPAQTLAALEPTHAAGNVPGHAQRLVKQIGGKVDLSDQFELLNSLPMHRSCRAAWTRNRLSRTRWHFHHHVLLVIIMVFVIGFIQLAYYIQVALRRWRQPRMSSCILNQLSVKEHFSNRSTIGSVSPLTSPGKRDRAASGPASPVCLASRKPVEARIFATQTLAVRPGENCLTVRASGTSEPAGAALRA